MTNKTKLWIKLGFFFIIIWLLVYNTITDINYFLTTKKECYEWETVDYTCICEEDYYHYLAVYGLEDRTISSTDLTGRICDTGNKTVYTANFVNFTSKVIEYINYWKCEPNKECIKWVRVYE